MSSLTFPKGKQNSFRTNKNISGPRGMKTLFLAVNQSIYHSSIFYFILFSDIVSPGVRFGGLVDSRG